MLDQYKEAMDDSAREILRRLTADYAEQVHDLADRLETNLAEKRHRDKKRATAAESDAMADVGEDGEGWHTSQRRRGTSSASGGRRAQGAMDTGSPGRAGGGPQQRLLRGPRARCPVRLRQACRVLRRMQASPIGGGSTAL